MTAILSVLKDTIIYVFETLMHNAPALALGLLVAAGVKVYVDPDKFKKAIRRRAGISIPGSVAFGAFTPFCACGTMAVIVSMMATALPWGPVMAFLTSSPLMSPDTFILYSGIISPSFAIALAVASIIIGLASGFITHFIEKKTNFLDGQIRFRDRDKEADATDLADTAVIAGCCGSSSDSRLTAARTSSVSCACSRGDEISEEVLEISGGSGCCAAVNQRQGFVEHLKLKDLFLNIYEVGIKQILLYFSIFAAIGYLINRFVPATLITEFFGAGNAFSVPLSAVIGLPLYVSGSSSIPLINAFIHGGASGGAMLAFMITGPGTSAGVIAGIATIMKKRAIALYLVFLLAGGVLMGYAYDLFLMLAG